MADKSQPPDQESAPQRPAQDDTLTDTLTNLQEQRVSRMRTRVLLVLICIMSVVVVVPALLNRQRVDRIVSDLEEQLLVTPPASQGGAFTDTKPIAEEGAVREEPVLTDLIAAQEEAASAVSAAAEKSAEKSSDATAKAVPEAQPVNHSGSSVVGAAPSPASVDKIAGLIRSAGLSETAAQRLAELITAESNGLDIDPLFTAAVVMAESSFKAEARSANGKTGLMQISPAMEKYILRLAGTSPGRPGSLTDPKYNLELGLWYLKFLERFYKGSLDDALAAYSWGIKEHDRARRGEIKMPAAVERYLSNVKKYYEQWSAVETAGGASSAASSTESAAPKEEALPAPMSAPSTETAAAPTLPAILGPVVMPEENKLVLAELISRESRQAGVEAGLVFAVIMAESTFDAQAVSSDGKIGLLQIEPGRGEAWAREANTPWEGAERLKDPGYNLQLGLPYLKKVLAAHPGDLDQALLVYNLGEPAAAEIKRGEKPLPPLAERYLRNIHGFLKGTEAPAKSAAAPAAK